MLLGPIEYTLRVELSVATDVLKYERLVEKQPLVPQRWDGPRGYGWLLVAKHMHAALSSCTDMSGSCSPHEAGSKRKLHEVPRLLVFLSRARLACKASRQLYHKKLQTFPRKGHL